MPVPLQPPDKALIEKASEVYQRLLVAYGDHPLKPRREPMHELVSTMLSHRTTEREEQLAYDEMRRRFGTWEAVRDAPLEKLTEAIQKANYPEAKARNIQTVLQRIITERGEATIDFLQELPVEKAIEWLTDLPGVGIKTATLVLLFCFSKPVLPVDTHVHRISQRLGLIGPKVTAEKAHALLLALFPPDPPMLFNFHINMLRHGQKLCTWQDPRCEKCPLTDICNWYQENRA
ncbi:MAG: endonuclease III [Chloroflexi bacterium]|nr:endonuclease III [Chloroflexota bacterium]